MQADRAARILGPRSRVRPSVTEQRHRHLHLERLQHRIGPGLSRVVGRVGQAHRAAAVDHAGRTDRVRQTVREGQSLLVARAARLRPVQGQPLVVEEMAPELGLHGGHRVLFGHGGHREAGWQLPDVPSRLPGRSPSSPPEQAATSGSASSASAALLQREEELILCVIDAQALENRPTLWVVQFDMQPGAVPSVLKVRSVVARISARSATILDSPKRNPSRS